MKSSIYIAIVLCLTSFTVAAQDGKGQPKVVASSPPAWTTTPSRFLGKADENYVKAMQARLAMAGRDVDVFGLPQDPSKKAPEPVLPKGLVVRKKKKIVTPFSDVINSMRVSMVITRDKSFIVQNRTLREGQEFPVKVRGEKMKVRVDSVQEHAITFTNLKTGESFERRLDLLPGVTAGGEISVPGMIESGKEEDVMEIEMANPIHTLPSAP